MVLKYREKIMIFLGVLAVAVWAFDHFYYMPHKKKIAELKAEIAAVDSKLTQARAFRQGVEATEREITRLEKEMQVYRERLLRGEELRTFLKQLAKDSERLAIKIISLSPQEAKSPEEIEHKEQNAEYKKVAVQMAMWATYRSLESFISNLERLPFLISLDYLKVERQEDKYPYLFVTLEIGVQIYEKK